VTQAAACLQKLATNLSLINFFQIADNREYAAAAAAAPAAKRNEGKIVAVIGAVVDVQVNIFYIRSL
jgi:hypothetical protein